MSARASRRGLQFVPAVGADRRHRCRRRPKSDPPSRTGSPPRAGFDWRDAVRTAYELSAKHGLSIPIRGRDLFHVAIAIEVGAGAILTFDQEQKALAEAAGIRVLAPAVRRGR